MGPEITLLVVDPVHVFREGLAGFLRSRDWVGAVRTAADGREALRLIAERLPSVVLLSLASSGPDVLLLARAIADRAPLVAVAVPDAEDEITACAQAGVSGFVMREADFETLGRAVRDVAGGATACPPVVVGTLLRRFTEAAGASAASLGPARGTGPVDDARLTQREQEVLVLIDQHLTNKEIAARLRIEVRTVKNHVHNLLRKLQVSRRSEAIARLRAGSPEPQSWAAARVTGGSASGTR